VGKKKMLNRRRTVWQFYARAALLFKTLSKKTRNPWSVQAGGVCKLPAKKNRKKKAGKNPEIRGGTGEAQKTLQADGD